MSHVARALVALTLVGCGRTEPPAPPPPVPPVAAPVVKPAPGVDLEGPPAVAEPRGEPRTPMTPLALGADRAVVRVAVPQPPHGGAVAFTFADDRTGWVARTPESMQLPTVAYGDGKIYVSGGFGSVSFYAMDAHTGHIDWATTNLEDNGPTAAIYDRGRIIFNTESCTIFALDAKTGKRLWLRNIGDPTLAQPAVADGLVFASHPASDGQELSAYTVERGTPVWSRWIGSELLAAPVVAGDSVYISTTGGVTFRIRRATGKLVWSKPLRATTAPWIVGDEVFVTRRDAGKEQQIVVAADSGKVVREHTVSTGSYTADVPRDSADSQSVWAFEGSRPVVDHGVRYVAMGGEIDATDAATGAPRWQRTYGKPDQRSVGSVALAGSGVVIATRDGQLFGLDVDTGYTEWSYALGHKIVAEPVIAHGWVYASTTDGYVIALDVGDDTLDGWHMFGGNPQHDGAVEAPNPAKQASL